MNLVFYALCIALGSFVGRVSLKDPETHVFPKEFKTHSFQNCKCTANTPKPGKSACCMTIKWLLPPRKKNDGNCTQAGCPGPKKNCKWDYVFTLITKNCANKAWFFIPLVNGVNEPPLPLNPPPLNPQRGPIEVPCGNSWGWKIEEWTGTTSCVVDEVKFTCLNCTNPN